ncbi:hypothetical protein EBL87_11615 [Cereibacter sphaeroides]|nr:hypothetical protein EBL87_11615 [Cereibacter sphaeroides]AZB67705.1 hypothetical protein EBL86_04725 [Cereibacter sphaeroides]
MDQSERARRGGDGSRGSPRVLRRRVHVSREVKGRFGACGAREGGSSRKGRPGPAPQAGAWRPMSGLPI